MKPWVPASFDGAPPDASAPAAAGGHAVAPPSGPVFEAGAPLQRAQDFVRGLQQGIEEGRAQGHAIGRDEGWREGHRQGYQAGLAKGLEDALTDVARLSDTLAQWIDCLHRFPQVWADELNELVLAAATQLAAGAAPDRALVMKAVNDLLAGLPQPGATLTLRVDPGQWATWSAVVGELPEGLRATVHSDPQLQAGQAFVDIGATRIDVSDAARLALLKGALSLLPNARS
jgi:flagellar assembly protein FliH